MKIHAPKFLRSISKARAGYGFVLLLSVGLLFVSGRADAALTSPAPIVTGSQYGQDDALGKRAYNVANTQFEYAWPAEHPENRRLVSVTPPAPSTKQYLVAAFVNDITCTTTCKLEFRVSEDGGLTWGQALSGSTPWLLILSPKSDYTVYVDPNGYDLWVSYTYSDVSITETGVNQPLTYTKSKVQRLDYAGGEQKRWTLGITEEPTLPVGDYDCGGTGENYTRKAGITGIAVQKLASGGPRVWAFVSVCTVADRYTYAAYKNASDVGNLGVDWAVAKRLSSSENLLFGTTDYDVAKNLGVEPRVQAVSIGNVHSFALVTADPENWYGTLASVCTQVGTDAGGSLRLVLPNGAESLALRNPVNVADVHPFSIGPPNRTADCHGITGPGGYPLGFSAAASPTGTNTSRVVVAYVGGIDATYETYGAANATKLRVQNCDVDVGAGTVSCSEIPQTNFTGTYLQPSVTMDAAGKARIVVRDTSNGKLKVFIEAADNSWSATSLSSFSNVYVPGAIDTIPAGLTVNLGLPPFMWEDTSNNRIAFSANMGGTIIGTNPSYTSNPILGYGWSPSLGWISTNCANKPSQDCTNPFGLGIGLTAHGDVQTPDKDQLPDVRSVSGTAVLSPSSVTTFPIGGYAWSPNGGFLSLERRDNMCNADADCTGGEDWDYGNPPGLAYNNTTTVDQNIPLAKYDTSNQHVYGWGRFLSLCDLQDLDATAGEKFRCKDKDGGWVRLRGYYTVPADSYSVNFSDSTHFTRSGDECSAFTFDVGEVLAVGNEYLVVKTCSVSFPFGIETTSVELEFALQAPYTNPQAIENVSDKSYGVDAYWTGDHYELAGWAWGSDYGWIRFDPLIFLGYAWLETLFGNIYSGGDIILPNAKDVSDVRFNTCGESATEPCYVSTYRIEAGGSVTALDNGTGAADSASQYILKSGVNPTIYTCDLAAEPGKTYDAQYCVLQGSDVSALQNLVTRDGLPKLAFPTVGNTTVSYRNALGKLDVGGLTTLLGNPLTYPDPSATSRYFTTEKNRFGQTVYKTSNEDWTINQLSGWVNNPAWQSGSTPILPLNVTTAEATAQIAPLRSQVIHVQGNLTVDGQEAAANALNLSGAGTLTVFNATGVFPSNLVVIPSSSSKASCAGCAIVLDPGGTNEEYFSYTSYSSVTGFSGVKRIKACGSSPLPACPLHPNGSGQKIRFVWRLPYADNGTTTGGKNTAQRTTVVVDGNLNIQYNIIAADRAKDDDLISAIPAIVAADSIRDLPTIAFVVKGNVIIDPKVNKLTGAFIVTSTDTNQQPSVSGGIFSTGNDNDPAFCTGADKQCNPLKITGLLFARLFEFQRIGSLDQADKPAEQVIADERLFLNPPPGLEDVTKALPNPQRTLP